MGYVSMDQQTAWSIYRFKVKYIAFRLVGLIQLLPCHAKSKYSKVLDCSRAVRSHWNSSSPGKRRARICMIRIRMAFSPTMTVRDIAKLLSRNFDLKFISSIYPTCSRKTDLNLCEFAQIFAIFGHRLVNYLF